jgi:hypothetical protein
MLEILFNNAILLYAKFLLGATRARDRQVPSLRDLGKGVIPRYRRLKPPVNRVSSLRDGSADTTLDETVAQEQ